jgi:hypothetical protein
VWRFQSFVLLVFIWLGAGSKAQQILSSRSWGSMPSLLSGFITIVGGVHINNTHLPFQFFIELTNIIKKIQLVEFKPIPTEGKYYENNE